MLTSRNATLPFVILYCLYYVSSGLAISNRNGAFWTMHSGILRSESAVDNSCNLVASPRHFHNGNATFDLKSPREWLEYCEMEDGRDGAYTVIRCDFHPSNELWNIWGRPFHMNRLVRSIRSIQEPTTDEEISIAINATSHIMETLLQASGNSIMDGDALPDTLSDRVFTLTLTMLWTPTDQGIKVRGHAFHSGQLLVPSEYNPDPIIASIALIENVIACERRSLPNRYNNSPESKLSSWCRQRSPLEEEFKIQGIGEVFLTREYGQDDVELLEGLTSNLFIVYKDGSLRTPATDSVLGGYVRKLILHHAEDCGLRIQVGPLRLSEKSQWKEIFTSSAIRVISPVSKIVTVSRSSHDESRNLETLWIQKDDIVNSPSWKRIYSKILLAAREGESTRLYNSNY